LESWSFWMSAISFATRRVRLEEAIVKEQVDVDRKYKRDKVGEEWCEAGSKWL
jgi:hypothetical protein